MSAIKPIIREAKQAVLKGMARSKDDLHQVADNIVKHVDDVTLRTRRQDTFTDPNGNTPNGNGPGNGNDGADGGPRRDEQGRFAPNPDGPADSRYDRPSGWRAGMRDQAWNNAAADAPDGLVRDPVTGDVLDPNEPWVMGHPPGYEFRHHQQSAAERGLTRQEFLDEYYDMGLFPYRPESPSTSASGSHELGWSDYVGP